MKKLLLLPFLLITIITNTSAQCTTTNGTSCACKNGSTDCDLLPDIILGDETITASGNNGTIEYSQTGNGQENGRLRISVSTPNIGHGPLTVRASTIFICGTDTFNSNPGTCPGGGSPRNLCFQRVYHKTGNAMTYYDRPAGSMTYHPTHLHMHVDDWGVYTLRVRDTAISNPLQWPILGTGAKLGFCLMDYGTCSYYNGHCQDSLGNVLLNDSFPNFALGGGNYNCSPIEQGISSGYADIYYQYLDGMYITIPPGTCNGEYYIVVEIDPHNYFLEENENNNVIAIPYTLTKQVAVGIGNASVTPSLPSNAICEGSSITLTANSGNTYLWSNGDTTQSITVSQPGNYAVSVNTSCGAATSAPVAVTNITSAVTTVTNTAGCQGVAAMNATTTGTAHWFDAPVGGTDLFTGNAFTPSTAGLDTFYVESHDTLWGLSASVGAIDSSIGTGSYYSNDQHQIFTVYKPIILKTVKVYANSARNRTIELRNASGTVLQSRTVNLAQGTHVVTLNFSIAPGGNYQLGWAAGSAPDLYRNNTGANYPYNFGNIMSITNNSANDLARWYCYYDWQVTEQPVTCTSSRTAVVADIIPAPVLTMTGLDTLYSVYDAPVTITVIPTGGTLSGTGVANGMFSPGNAGIGGPYPVSYQYTDTATGCSSTVTIEVTVRDTTSGFASIEGITQVNIFPNPNKGVFELSLKATESKRIDLTVTDVVGQKVFEEKNVSVTNTLQKNINLNNAPKGIYHLQITSGKKQNTYPFVVE